MNFGDLLVYIVAGGLFFAFAFFPARAAYRCIREERETELGAVVIRSITRTVFGWGSLALIGGLILLNAASTGSGSGIMSKQMGFAVLLFFGALALLGYWVSAMLVGMIASALVRRLPAPTAALLMFLCISFTPLVAAALYALEDAGR